MDKVATGGIDSDFDGKSILRSQHLSGKRIEKACIGLIHYGISNTVCDSDASDVIVQEGGSDTGTGRMRVEDIAVGIEYLQQANRYAFG
ncbi:hypothetical protein ES708_21264 [subsurface metagenome]